MTIYEEIEKQLAELKDATAASPQSRVDRLAAAEASLRPRDEAPQREEPKARCGTKRYFGS